VTNPLIEAERIKREVIEELSRMLSEEERRAAERDSHAVRRERPCGITVHTGIGCDFGCVYCYIWDMGFKPPAKPYPLSPLQLVYAIARNPHVAVGEWGSLISVGSVTEPFLPKTAELTASYLEAIHQWLKNPIQISVKGVAPDHVLRRIASVNPSVLITVTTWRKWRVLEPGAPSPEERMEMAAKLVKMGVKVTLFMRPIIPGVTDAEAREILKAALDAGIETVVLGTLRVTPRIVKNLSAVGVDLSGRLPRLRGPREQVPIKASDLKQRIAKTAEEMGLRVLPASCAANIWAHEQACATCSFGPCGDLSKLPRIEHRHVAEYLETLGIKADVEVGETRIVIRLRRGRLNEAKTDFIKNVARREVVVR